MSERRARNEISRNAQLSCAAAELLDQGLGDAEVSARLNERFKLGLKARTVASFRRRDYGAIEAERLQRRERAAQVAMIVDGSAGTYAEAAQEILARMLYDLLAQAERGTAIEAKDLAKAGRELGRIREIEIANLRAQIERERHEQATRAGAVAADPALTPADRAQKIKEIFGLK